ncbi:hypothetical protein EGW08_019098 [Elysia chlorotica]|uniref:BPL/LPL catalytic domain-containing protein n=1 Tax=Elysia chlorotica TaxID=188477 RepID=A0A3S0ZQT7_ELYCH|nr:hypothetical protein EGW08_019098 [Elysia chlorotica]
MATFDTDLFLSLLESKYIAKTLVYTDVTGSTMDDARRLAREVSEYPHGSAILSERQTKARGARDHKWDASNTENIYISFILHLPQVYKTFEGRFDLEVAACLAVMQVARKFGVAAATPKWPNDVWVRGHKLAGNLVEDGRFNIPGSLNCLIILGMGINVNSDVRRNSELSSIATSIKCERGGVPVSREKFLADLCACLEINLEQNREANLDLFRRENLFGAFQDISVSCPSEGRVIDGKFLEICDNWEVCFSDKSNGEILQGRSDQYTVRPKVLNKILIIFTTIPAVSADEGDGDEGGDAGKESPPATSRKSAQRVASMLQALVDTSKYVVCLVPESLVTDTDEWMKTCSLLILPEPVASPPHVSSKLNTFLGLGGRVLASGQGSLFLAKSLDIPLKEVFIQPSQTHLDLSLVYVKASLPTIPEVHAPSSLQPVSATGTLKNPDKPTSIKSNEEGLSELSTESKLSSLADDASLPLMQAEIIVFPSEHVCFQFFEDEKAMLAESSASLQGTQDKADPPSNQKEVKVQQQEINAYSEGTPSSAGTNGKTKVWAVYGNADNVASPNNIAACSIKSCFSADSCVTLVGFDIGTDFDAPTFSTSQIEEEIQRVSDDTFKREVFVQQIVDFVLSC